MTPALGIDLGTTNSVAAVIHDSQLLLIADEHGIVTHPSLLRIDANHRVYVGRSALEGAERNELLFSLKRLIGQELSSQRLKSLNANIGYQIVRGSHKEPYVSVHGQRYAIPELCGMIVRYLRDLAELSIQNTVNRAVITVPAHFNDQQRQMTKLACELAGLKVLRMINEPTAAALGYGFGQELSKRLIVVDLGGGTFDVTVLDIDGRIIEVLATGGDGELGGDDFDHIFEVYLRENLGLNELKSPLSPAEMIALRQTKHQLSQHRVLEIKNTPLAAFTSAQDQTISQSDMISEWRSLIQRAITLIEETVEHAGMSVQEADEMILVGGATRMPSFRAAMARYFGKPPLTDADPDTVVAAGAASQAYALIAAGFTEPEDLPLLIDVLPQSLGVGSIGGTVERLIPKNTVVPVAVQKTFATSVDHQTSVRLGVYQGESSSISEAELLGEIELDGLPPAPRGEVTVDVIFEIDVNGCLTVKAIDYLSGVRQVVRLQVSSGYEEESVREMRRKSRKST